MRNTKIKKRTSGARRLVIVGGGFGGIKTAISLARNKQFAITLISDKDHFVYYPSMYSTATGRSYRQSVIPLAEVFKNYPEVNVVVDPVISIDKHRKHVVGASGRHYDYDTAVFALGVVTSYFGIKGLDKYSYSIKSKAEVVRFKSHLHNMLTEDHHLDCEYIVVGAGPTGVELSASLATYLRSIAKSHRVRSKKISLTLVEAAPRILPRMSEAASKIAQERLKDLGVQIRTDARVEKQNDEQLYVNGKPLHTHTVIWTSGVMNHPFFAEHADIFELEKNGRVKVDKHMKAAPSIYVIGDNASTPYTGLAQTALHDAIFVSKVLKSLAKKSPAPEYKAIKPPVVVPVGHNWALFEWGPLRFGGILGSLLRRAADAIGYHDLLPIGHALAVWRSEAEFEEDCAVCNRKPKRKK